MPADGHTFCKSLYPALSRRLFSARAVSTYDRVKSQPIPNSVKNRSPICSANWGSHVAYGTISALNLHRPGNDFGNEKEQTEDAVIDPRSFRRIPYQRETSRNAAQKRRKEDKSLVNQHLKDKGQLSYNWRIPLGLLEQHGQAYEPPQSLESQVDRAPRVSSTVQASVPIARIPSKVFVLNKLARDIVRPEDWSAKSLVEYMEDVAATQYANDKVYQRYSVENRSSSNRDEVTRIFGEIFQLPELRKFLSVVAFNVALRFCYSQGLFSKARSLFILMEDLKIGIPPETFNVVLQGAASARDLHGFTFILQKGIQRGFRPDKETWNLFLMAVTSEDVKAVIIQKMWERGIAGCRDDVRGSMRSMIQNELAFHIDNCGRERPILEYLDRLYGIGWLSTSTGNKLLHEFTWRFTSSEALALLPGLKERGFRADEISLQTLLHHCLLLRQHKGAIEALEAFRYHFGLWPGKGGYEILFLMAWRSRFLNWSRIIWKYACLYGYTTRKMRTLVLQSLSSADSTGISDNKAARFRGLLGKFVIFASKSHELGESTLMPMNGTKSPRSHLMRARLARIQLQSDLSLARTADLPRDLCKLLLEALELDMQCEKEGTLSHWTMSQILEGGLSLEMQKPFNIRTHIAMAEPVAKPTPLHNNIYRRISSPSRKDRLLRFTKVRSNMQFKQGQQLSAQKLSHVSLRVHRKRTNRYPPMATRVRTGRMFKPHKVYSSHRKRKMQQKALSNVAQKPTASSFGQGTSVSLKMRAPIPVPGVTSRESAASAYDRKRAASASSISDDAPQPVAESLLAGSTSQKYMSKGVLRDTALAPVVRTHRTYTPRSQSVDPSNWPPSSPPRSLSLRPSSLTYYGKIPPPIMAFRKVREAPREPTIRKIEESMVRKPTIRKIEQIMIQKHTLRIKPRMIQAPPELQKPSTPPQRGKTSVMICKTLRPAFAFRKCGASPAQQKTRMRVSRTIQTPTKVQTPSTPLQGRQLSRKIRRSRGRLGIRMIAHVIHKHAVDFTPRPRKIGWLPAVRKMNTPAQEDRLSGRETARLHASLDEVLGIGEPDEEEQ